MQKRNPRKKLGNPQKQLRSGIERKMHPQPVVESSYVIGSGKLRGKIAIITGGDSGNRKAEAIPIARDGADFAISYLNEHLDAKATRKAIEIMYGRKCLMMLGDVSWEKHCINTVNRVTKDFG